MAAFPLQPRNVSRMHDSLAPWRWRARPGPTGSSLLLRLSEEEKDAKEGYWWHTCSVSKKYGRLVRIWLRPPRSSVIVGLTAIVRHTPGQPRWCLTRSDLSSIGYTNKLLAAEQNPEHEILVTTRENTRREQHDTDQQAQRNSNTTNKIKEATVRCESYTMNSIHGQ